MPIPEFEHIRLPEHIERGAQGGPMFKTQILQLAGGFEQRNIEWSQSKAEWDVSYGIDSPHDLQDVVDFFYSRYGRAVGFRFKDWVDFRVGYARSGNPHYHQQSLEPELLGVGDGQTKEYLAVKRYQTPASEYVRRLTCLVDGTVRVFIDEQEVDSGDMTVDADTGRITLDSPPAIDAEVRFAAEFDVPVRFDVDKLSQSVEWAGAMSIDQIKVVEIRRKV